MSDRFCMICIDCLHAARLIMSAKPIAHVMRPPSVQKSPLPNARPMGPLYSPGHRWVYVSDMTPSEAWLFKLYDTARTAGGAGLGSEAGLLLEALVAEAFHGGAFRAYHTDDVVGAELGGALKNVIAIATGVADGIGAGQVGRAGGAVVLVGVGVAAGLNCTGGPFGSMPDCTLEELELD